MGLRYKAILHQRPNMGLTMYGARKEPRRIRKRGIIERKLDEAKTRKNRPPRMRGGEVGEVFRDDPPASIRSIENATI